MLTVIILLAKCSLHLHQISASKIGYYSLYFHRTCISIGLIYPSNIHSPQVRTGLTKAALTTVNEILICIIVPMSPDIEFDFQCKISLDCFGSFGRCGTPSSSVCLNRSIKRNRKDTTVSSIINRLLKFCFSSKKHHVPSYIYFVFY